MGLTQYVKVNQQKRSRHGNRLCPESQTRTKGIRSYITRDKFCYPILLCFAWLQQDRPNTRKANPVAIKLKTEKSSQN